MNVSRHAKLATALLLLGLPAAAQDRTTLQRTVREGLDSLWHAPVAWAARLRSTTLRSEGNALRIRHRALVQNELAEVELAWRTLQSRVERGERIDERAELERLSVAVGSALDRLGSWETAFLDEASTHAAFRGQVQGVRRATVASAFPEVAQLAEAHAATALERRLSLHPDVEEGHLPRPDEEWGRIERAHELALSWTQGLEHLTTLARVAPMLQAEHELATTLIAELPGGERDAARAQLEAFAESVRATVPSTSDLAALSAVVELAARRGADARKRLESRLTLLRALTATEERARDALARVQHIERSAEDPARFPEVRRRIALTRAALERRRSVAADARAGEEAFDAQDFERALAALDAIDERWPDLADRIQRDVAELGWNGPDVFAEAYEGERVAWERRAIEVLDAQATDPTALATALTTWRTDVERRRAVWLEVAARFVAVERELASPLPVIHAKDPLVVWWTERERAFRGELVQRVDAGELEPLRDDLTRTHAALQEAGALLRRNVRSGFDDRWIFARRVFLRSRVAIAGTVDPLQDERDLWLILQAPDRTCRVRLDDESSVTLDLLPWNASWDTSVVLPWPRPFEPVTGTEFEVRGPAFLRVRAGLASSSYALELVPEGADPGVASRRDDGAPRGVFRALLGDFLGGVR